MKGLASVSVPEVTPSLRELVEVADVETVVRLDGPAGRLRELVLTGDVIDSLGAVLEGATGDTGAGFFVVGPFGSGKSHFLAALGELLAEPGAAADFDGWDRELRRLAGGARQSAVVAVPLIEYRAVALVEDVVADRAWRALGHEPAPTGDDRVETWDALLDAALKQGHEGLVLLVDELSEFLRAKQGPALTEDLRFLQFLGEWASSRPVVVIAALQESIEEVANVSQRELARIRDRYRPSLHLSMRHVEDLVRGRLVRLRPGAEVWIDRAWQETTAAFPDGHFPRDRFGRCYPLHPDTLSVLEGLRFLLSQQRGVVDFICHRLRDSLDRGYAELVTPDEVFDHFRGRLLERPESSRLAETVVPYFERTLGELIDPEDRNLALRTVKLLCLLAASPLERPRSASELASMLAARVSDIDPSANVGYLERAVLEPITEQGAYIVAKPGPPTTYSVQLDADAALVARARAAQVRAELSFGDRRLIATLQELGSSPQLPLQLLGEVGLARRELVWQNTQRALLVGSARVLELTAEDGRGLVAQARASGAEGCLLLSEMELDEGAAAQERAATLVAAQPRLALWVPAVLRPDERDTALDIHSRTLVLRAAGEEGRTDLVEVLERAREADSAVAREILRRVYFEGQLAAVDLPSLSGLPFDRQLSRLADPMLAGLHPRHREVQPRAELIGDRLVRQMVEEVIGAGKLGPASVARGQLRPLIEGYLVPLGLVRLRNDGATLSPDASRSPAVAEALRLVGDGEPVDTGEVLRGLADGPVGLSVPEAILVLNACVQSGLLEAWRGRRRQTEPFLAVTATDRLGAGELVEPAVRAAVAAMSPVFGPGAVETWSAGVQRSAWDYARSWLDARREEVVETKAGLSRFGEVPALNGADPGPVLDDLAAVDAVVGACPLTLGAAAGLRQLVAATADLDVVVAASRRLGAVCRFLRDEMRRTEEAAAYLTHPDLTIPESDQALVMLRDGALGRLREALAIAAQDRAGDLFGAYREFRSAYLAAYQQAHEAYYSPAATEAMAKVRATPVYQALARLSQIKAVAVPDDRVKVDRLLFAAAPEPCRRPVSVELGWKPRCSCGLALGDKPPTVDAQAVTAVAERGVRQYLDELGSPELAARLRDAVADLNALGRDELGSDVGRVVELAGSLARAELAGPGKPVELAELTALLHPDVLGVLRDVLSGSQLIVTRDLAVLREDLIGRRYPKRKLLEILSAWVDAAGGIPPAGFVEVVDSSESAPGAPELGPATQSHSPSTGTAGFLAQRFPGVAALLPAQHGADAFWLAAWWADRPGTPAWIPTRLAADPGRLRSAAAAAAGDLAARAELADLDARVGPNSLLGDQVAAALDLGSGSATRAAEVLSEERLLRHPIRLAADQLLRRATSDWSLSGLVDLDRLAGEHALCSAAELAGLVHLLDAARHLSALERGPLDAAAGSPSGEIPRLVESLYPTHYAPVRELISRAELAAATADSLIGSDTIGAFRSASDRLLAEIDAGFAAHADGGFAGCLRVWEIGEAVIGPLLAKHGRVAVLVVDAMRADLASKVIESVSKVLAARPVEWRWAVVPSPTRTAESIAAMHLGRPVGAGSAPSHPGPGDVPFAHLGYEAEVVVGADRDALTADTQRLWSSGPPISVAVATGVDERLHRTSVELAALIDEAVVSLGRRVIPSLSALPAAVPLVVLSDHGFRENHSWGQGPNGRYVHGGTSLEECVIPVVTFGAEALSAR